MKLITETIYTDYSVDEILDESTGKKNLFIEGIFMQAEVKNRNGRIYPSQILKKEVERYVNAKVKTRQAIGELNHPTSPVPNPERASHLITELKMIGNNVHGKAKILSRGMGEIVRGLIEDGVQLGVSSRGLGTLRESNGAKIVQPDYYLATVDIVGDPSAPSAFVNGLYEGVEWIYQNGDLIQVAEGIKNELDKNFDETKSIAAFKTFLDSIK